MGTRDHGKSLDGYTGEGKILGQDLFDRPGIWSRPSRVS